MQSSRPRARIVLVLLAAGLGACSGAPTEPVVGDFNGEWDGAAWHGRAYAVLERDTLWLVAHRPDPEHYYDEYIRAQIAFSGPGTYDVPPAGGELAKMTGGDAGYWTRAAGTLTVSRYDARTGAVAGTVSLQGEFDGALWTAGGRFDAPLYPSFAAVPPPPGR